MSNKQFKTYCRIIDYVEQANPDLASLIRGLCADMIMSSLKGKPGITFLMPQDKALISKLEKLAYSEKPEEATKAGDMLNAMIIRDVFKTPAEWKSREVPNALMPPQVVEVESTSAKEVVFKSGARAVLDENFRDASRRQNLAVWKLVSGEIPVTTDKPAQSRFTKPPKGKLGGYNPTPSHAQGDRFKIAIAVENAYALHRLQCDSGAVHQPRDVYLDNVLSLINYILSSGNEALVVERVLPLLSLDKIDFYFLIEPHKPSPPYLLDDSIIHDWWEKRNSQPFSGKAVLAHIERLLSGTSSTALIYSNKQHLIDSIESIRSSLNNYINAKPRLCIDEIEKYYNTLDTSNTIGGHGPVFPEALANYYRSEPGLKFIQDELRFLTYDCFKRLETEGFQRGDFHELTNMIGECLYAANSAGREQAHKLLNKNTIKYLIAPSENIHEVRVFVSSTAFLYTPLLSCSLSLAVKNSTARPTPSRMVLFNISKDLYVQHQRLLDMPVPNTPDIASLLKTLNVNTLDPELKAELLRKLSS